MRWMRDDKTFNIETLLYCLRQAKLPLSLVDRYATINFTTEHESLGVDDSLIALVVISDLAFDAFDGDRLNTAGWIVNPNDLFFGMSPFEMCAAGRAQTVIETLLEWLGRDSLEWSSSLN
jgi:hypothetical protein